MIIKKYDMLYKIAYVNKLTIEITELVIRNLISNSVNIELYINDRFGLEKDSFDNYNILDLLLKYDNINVFKYLFEAYKIKYTDTNNIGYNLVFRSVYFNANKIFDFFITKIEPTIILSMRSNINNIKVTSIDFIRSPQWRELRQRAIAKYGSTCVKCGRVGSKRYPINIDHIKPRKYYPELALDINNLQPLCGGCNKRKGNKVSPCMPERNLK
jgi:hypothetical protein